MNQLTQINQSYIINTKLSKDQLFHISIKVFLYSYYGWDSISETVKQVYDENFNNFYDEMQKVFEKQYDKTATVAKIMEEIGNEEFVLQCGVLQVRGISQFQNVGITVDVGITGQRAQHIHLNANAILQTNTDTYLANVRPDILSQLRTGNNAITMRLRVNDNPLADAANDFTISYSELHPEGFTDWHVFGETNNEKIEALIKIKLSLLANTSVHSHAQSEQIHNHLLMNILLYRMREERKIKLTIKRDHDQSVNRKQTNLLIKKVRPDSQFAFWLKMYTELPYFQDLTKAIDLVDSIDWRQYLSIDHLTRVPYNDLDISSEFWTEFPSKAINCISDDWCNWSAFYYFNPILRFLMVQHNNLFLRNNAKLPEIYLFFTSYYIDEASKKQLKTPLFNLLKSAKYYCEQSNDLSRVNRKHFNSRQTFAKNTYSPKATVSAAIAYNLLRKQLHLKQIKPGTGWSYADIVDIQSFYDVLHYLHFNLSGDAEIIPANRLENWLLEMDRVSRAFYYKALQSMIEIQTDKDIAVDDLFSVEEFRKDMVILTEEEELNAMRFLMQSLVHDFYQNPYNEKFICSPQFYDIILASEYLNRVSTLAKINQSRSFLDNEQKYCAKLDQMLNKLADTIITSNQNPAQIMTAVKYSSYLSEQTVCIYYALKTYRMMFDIQAHIIIGFCLLNRKPQHIVVDSKLPTKTLQFVFRNDWCELIVNHSNAECYVFNENCERIVESVNEFYNYWGKGRHEQQGITNDARIDHLIHEYGRLYHWWKCDGNNSVRFLKIFATTNQYMSDVFNRGFAIFTNNVLEVWANTDLKYAHKTEIVDHLVHWLAKAVCTKFVRIAAHVLIPMDRLEDKTLVTGSNWFGFCKPGYVPIIRFYKTIVDYVHKTKILYIQYDDEFDRIANAFDSTTRMIKVMFRDYWKYLVSIWWQEVVQLLDLAVGNRNKGKLVLLHMIVGISVIYPFVDDFRFDSFHFRKSVEKKANEYLGNQLFMMGFGFKAQFARVWIHFKRQWAAQKRELEIAIPLVSEIWNSFLEEIIKDFGDGDQ